MNLSILNSILDDDDAVVRCSGRGEAGRSRMASGQTFTREN